MRVPALIERVPISNAPADLGGQRVNAPLVLLKLVIQKMAATWAASFVSHWAPLSHKFLDLLLGLKGECDILQ